MVLHMTLLRSLVCQELKRHFSNMFTDTHTAVTLSNIMQKVNESLCIHMFHHSRLQYAAVDKTACENIDPTRIYHFIASINNTSIAEKIAMQVQDTTRCIQKGPDTGCWLKEFI